VRAWSARGGGGGGRLPTPMLARQASNKEIIVFLKQRFTPVYSFDYFAFFCIVLSSRKSVPGWTFALWRRWFPYRIYNVHTISQ